MRAPARGSGPARFLPNRLRPDGFGPHRAAADNRAGTAARADWARNPTHLLHIPAPDSEMRVAARPPESPSPPDATVPPSDEGLPHHPKPPHPSPSTMSEPTPTDPASRGRSTAQCVCGLTLLAVWLVAVCWRFLVAG